MDRIRAAPSGNECRARAGARSEEPDRRLSRPIAPDRPVDDAPEPLGEQVDVESELRGDGVDAFLGSGQ